MGGRVMQFRSIPGFLEASTFTGLVENLLVADNGKLLAFVHEAHLEVHNLAITVCNVTLLSARKQQTYTGAENTLVNRVA